MNPMQEHRSTPSDQFDQEAFWRVFQQRHPSERASRVKKSAEYWHRKMHDQDVVIRLHVAPSEGRIGVSFGHNEKHGAVDVDARLAPYRRQIDELMQLRPETRGHEKFASYWYVDCINRNNWPAMTDWLVTEAGRLEDAVRTVLKDPA